MTSNNDDEDYLDLVSDPTVKEILRKQINDVAFNDNKFQKKLKESKVIDNKITLTQRSSSAALNLLENQKDQYQDYQAELNPYKRERTYEYLEPEKFKKIGYMNGTILRKPIFRLTDLYLPSSDKVQKMIDSIFREKIYGRHSGTTQLQTRFDNSEQLQKIYNNWQRKQDYDEFENDKNDLNENQLEDIVVNMGDKKENYFLLLKSQKQKRRVDEYQKQRERIKNLPVANPNFMKFFKKQVTLLSQKNRIIEEFESDEDGNQDINNGLLNNNKKLQSSSTSQNKLFGGFKFASDKAKLPILKANQQESKTRSFNTLGLPLVQENLNVQLKQKNQKRFNEQLIRYYSYSNNEIVNNAHKRQLQDLNRIEYHLANSDFFLPKLHIALQRNHDMNKMKQNQHFKGQATLARNQNISQLNKSRISDSLFTGNRQQISKPSINQGSGQHLPLLQQDQETIQKRIQIEMRNIYKQPLYHSEVATKFELVKFTLDEREFSNFHRYEFPYHYYFKYPTTVKPVYHKPRNIKPKDLIINTEMKNSNIKYSKVESLSLSQGQFILIEHIQEHPLLLSNVGMCQRMFIQVNNQEMIQKINQDMIKNAPFDDLQDMRDNPNQRNNGLTHNTFKSKCELWRKNIKETFGDHGKMFLWDQKNAGKLIGSPEGLGVALMESNLSAYPIVKKKTQYNSRDFLLVREGDRWFLRKIEHIYVSGQVQPKKKIFNPDSRDYSPIFKEKYKKAFMIKQILTNRSVNFEKIRQTFIGQSQASLKKPLLKSIRATSNDNKNYTVLQGINNLQFDLTVEDVCLYERMQKSICMLKSAGIKFIKNNEKMKNVLKQFNKRHIDNLEKFTISRMIKDELLLTSWYLTDSFLKFKNRQSKIQIVGMADPTNGKGGYSFINKPQKERTARQDMDDKGEKQKVSGTTSDLRGLKTKMLGQFLLSRGYSEEDIQGKGRWGLVSMVKKQDNTQYARKQRQTKLQKAQNQKKQLSRVFNKLLSYLNDQTPVQVFNYNFKRKITLDQLMKKQQPLWMKIKDKMKKGLGNHSSDDEDDFQDEMDE